MTENYFYLLIKRVVEVPVSASAPRQREALGPDKGEEEGALLT